MSGKSDKSDRLKERLLEALENNLGIVTAACKQAGCSRETFYRYRREDQEFAKAVKDITEQTLDFVENSLLQQIEGKNTTATIFYLKTKGKHRGYIEGSNVEQPRDETEQGCITLPDGTEIKI